MAAASLLKQKGGPVHEDGNRLFCIQSLNYSHTQLLIYLIINIFCTCINAVAPFVGEASMRKK